MNQDSKVNAGDIARLVRVGRAAVSNWRRRHEDFPQPVGGTAASPLFSLREVQDWLHANGKAFSLGLPELIWQRLRATTDDLYLGRQVGAAGVALLTMHTDWATVCKQLPIAEELGADELDPELVALVRQLSGDVSGTFGAFEFLCGRYQEAHSRRLSTTPPDLVGLMVDLATGCTTGPVRTVLDPACGLGNLLVGLRSVRLLGQDSDNPSALIAGVRLLLSTEDSRVVVGDSLRANAFANELADMVVCDPPHAERAWGYQDLTSDPRWVYGLPPRGESELAWVQHCLAQVRPGGAVVITVPSVVASRRPGRRIRANLLRAGALRAVITLSPAGPDLWVLRRPMIGERPPAELLLVSAQDMARFEHSDLLVELVTDYVADPDPFADQAVPVIDLLDDDVDISPARHRSHPNGRRLVAEYDQTLARFRAVVPTVPELTGDPTWATRTGTTGDAEPATITVGELIRAGSLTVQYAPTKPAPRPVTDAELPVHVGYDFEATDLEGVAVAMLTSDDLAHGVTPSARVQPTPGQVVLAAGDVVATPGGLTRVVTDGGAVLGPYLACYRVDLEVLDPYFLAGCLRTAAAGSPTGSSRLDARRTRLPRLPLDRQQELGRAFVQLTVLADQARETARLAESLVRLGFDGLVSGVLRPRRDHETG